MADLPDIFPKRPAFEHCHGCLERHVGCHADCVYYAEDKDANDRRKEALAKASKADRMDAGYNWDTTMRSPYFRKLEKEKRDSRRRRRR